jgi:hypothetical protein
MMEEEMTDRDFVVADRFDAEGLTIQYRLPRAGAH